MADNFEKVMVNMDLATRQKNPDIQFDNVLANLDAIAVQKKNISAAMAVSDIPAGMQVNKSMQSETSGQLPLPPIEQFATDVMTEPADRPQYDPLAGIPASIRAAMTPEQLEQARRYDSVMSSSSGNPSVYDMYKNAVAGAENIPQGGPLSNPDAKMQKMIYSPLVTENFTPEQIYNWENSGSIGAIEGLEKMSDREIKEKFPAVGTLVSLKNSADLKLAVDRLSDPQRYQNLKVNNTMPIGMGRTVFDRWLGNNPYNEGQEDATDQQKLELMQKDIAIVSEYLNRRAELEVRGTTITNDIVQGALELPDFIVTFALTGPGASIVKEGVEKSTVKLITKVLGKEAAEKILQKKGIQLGGKLMGASIDAAARTAQMIPDIMANAGDRYVDSGQYKLTDTGLELIQRPEDFSRSIIKAAGDMYIENLTEISGKGLTAAGKKIGGAIGKVGEKLPGSQFAGRILSGLEKVYNKSGAKQGAFTDFVQNNLKVGSFVEELSEEELGTILRAATGVEDYGAGEDAGLGPRMLAAIENMTDGREFLTTAGVLMVPAAARKAGSVIEGQYNKYQDDRAFKTAESLEDELPRVAGQEPYDIPEREGYEQDSQFAGNSRKMNEAYTAERQRSDLIATPLAKRLKPGKDGYKMSAKTKEAANTIAGMLYRAFDDIDIQIEPKGKRWQIIARQIDPAKNRRFDAESIDVMSEVALEDVLADSASSDDIQRLFELGLTLDDFGNENQQQFIKAKIESSDNQVAKEYLQAQTNSVGTVSGNEGKYVQPEFEAVHSTDQHIPENFEGVSNGGSGRMVGKVELSIDEFSRIQDKANEKSQTLYVRLNKNNKPVLGKDKPQDETPYLEVEPQKQTENEQLKDQKDTEPENRQPKEKTDPADSEPDIKKQEQSEKTTDDPIQDEIDKLEKEVFYTQMADKITPTDQQSIRNTQERIKQLKQQQSGRQPEEAPAPEIEEKEEKPSKSDDRSELKQLIDSYDEDEISTISDLIDEVEVLADDTEDVELQQIVEKVRTEQHDNRYEYGLRGDSDAYEGEFEDAVRKLIDNQPVETVEKPETEDNTRENVRQPAEPDYTDRETSKAAIQLNENGDAYLGHDNERILKQYAGIEEPTWSSGDKAHHEKWIKSADDIGMGKNVRRKLWSAFKHYPKSKQKWLKPMVESVIPEVDETIKKNKEANAKFAKKTSEILAQVKAEKKQPEAEKPVKEANKPAPNKKPAPQEDKNADTHNPAQDHANAPEWFGGKVIGHRSVTNTDRKRYAAEISELLGRKLNNSEIKLLELPEAAGLLEKAGDDFLWMIVKSGKAFSPKHRKVASDALHSRNGLTVIVPKKVSRIGKVNTTKQLVSTVLSHSGTEQSRYVINDTFFVADTGEVVATDGRRMLIADGLAEQLPEVEGEQIYERDKKAANGYSITHKGKYPRWTDIVPDKIITIEKEISADQADRIVAVANTTEKANPNAFVADGYVVERAIKIPVKDFHVGINLAYLRDAVKVLRQLGSENLSFAISGNSTKDNFGPFVLSGMDSFGKSVGKVIIMPINLAGEKKAIPQWSDVLEGEYLSSRKPAKPSVAAEKKPESEEKLSDDQVKRRDDGRKLLQKNIDESEDIIRQMESGENDSDKVAIEIFKVLQRNTTGDDIERHNRIVHDQQLVEKAYKGHNTKLAYQIAGRINGYIQDKDLNNLISHVTIHNKASRKAFEVLTGTKLPKTAKKTVEHLREWAGVEAVNKYERHQQEQEQLQEESRRAREREVLIANLDSEHVRYQGKTITTRNWLEELVKDGYTEIVRRKVGAVNRYHLKRPEDKSDSDSWEVNKNERRYVEILLEDANKPDLTAIGDSLEQIVKAVSPAAGIKLEKAVRSLAQDVDKLIAEGKLVADQRESFIEQKLKEAGLAGENPDNVDVSGSNYIAGEKAVISLAITNSDPTTAIHEAVESRIKIYFGDVSYIERNSEIKAFRKQIEELSLDGYTNDKSNLEWLSDFLTDYLMAGLGKNNNTQLTDAVNNWQKQVESDSSLVRLFAKVIEWFRDAVRRASILREYIYDNPDTVDLTLAKSILNSDTMQDKPIDIDNPEITYQLRKRSYGDIEVLPESTFDSYKKLKDTNWGRAVAKRAVVRNEIIDILNNKIPETDIVETKNNKLYQLLQDNGIEGVFSYIVDTGVIGKAGKPTLAVNSSLAHCNPSDDCARFCYATGGNYSYSGPMIKSEIIDIAASLDPQRLGRMISNQYKPTANHDANKALRFNDIGDLSEDWVSVIDEVNRNGIRCQVFSKRPELLAKIDKRNVRLLSVDRTNTHIADDNDLPIAFTYQSEDDLDNLVKYADRIQVILPVKLGSKLLSEDQLENIPDNLQPYVCPVDSGRKKLAGKGTNSGWTCTKCDREGKGVGCFFNNEGSFKSDTVDNLLYKLERALEEEGFVRQDAESLIREIKLRRGAINSRAVSQGPDVDVNTEALNSLDNSEYIALAETFAGSKLNAARLAKAFGVSPGKVSQIDQQGVYAVDLPNGQTIKVNNAELEITGRGEKSGYRGLWSNIPGKITLSGGREIDFDGMIKLSSYYATDDTLSHEQFHAAMDLALSEKERSIVLKRFDGDEEKAAETYGRWAALQDRKGYPYFKKIRDYFRRIWTAITGKQNIGDIFNRVYSGKVWNQESDSVEKGRHLRYQKQDNRPGTYLTGKGIDNTTAEDVQKLFGEKGGKQPENSNEEPESKEKRSILKQVKKYGKGGFQKTASLFWGITNVLEPTKMAQKSFGYDTTAEIVRMAATPDVGMLKFGQNKLENMEMTFKELADAISQLPPDQQEYIFHYRGKAKTEGGKYLQEIARDNITDQAREYAGYLSQLYDKAFELLDSLDEVDAMYHTDYFYGAYQDPQRAKEQLGSYYPTTQRMVKTKKIPSVADAHALGLKLQDTNPALNAFREVAAIWRLAAMIRWRDYLVANHYGSGIIKAGDAEFDQVKGWRKLYFKPGSDTEEPIFSGYILHPDLYRPTAALNSVNVTGKGIVKTFRTIVHTINGIKLFLPTHHMRTIAAQCFVDGNGVLGVLNPFTWTKVLSYKVTDDMERSQPYLEYVGLGGTHKGSFEMESKQALDRWFRGERKWQKFYLVDKLWSLERTRARFNKWIFEIWIPGVKYAKYLQQVDKLREKQGYEPTDAQKIEIIKTGQNFYGEMNERIFGRSSSVSSLMRFVFMMPGFREGNFRSMFRAGMGIYQTFNKKADRPPNGPDYRSLVNIPLYMILTGMVANIFTLAFTGSLPDGPEDGEMPEEWLRDIFKVDSGRVDDKGRPILIDFMTTDKDYYQQIVQPAIELFSGRPFEAAQSFGYNVVHTIGGMTSIPRGIYNDFDAIAQGKVLTDWKGDRVWYSSDDAITKAVKFLQHEYRHVEPIPASAYRQMRHRGIDSLSAITAAGTAMRVSHSELERRRSSLWQKFFDMRNRRTDLRKLAQNGKLDQGEINYFNSLVDDALTVKALPIDLKDYLEDLRLPDLTELLDSIDDYDKRSLKKKVKMLKNAGKTTEAVRQINIYNKEHPETKVTLGNLLRT